MQELSAQVKQFAERAAAAKQQLDELVARLPNLPDPAAADGPEDERAQTGRRACEPRRSSRATISSSPAR